MSRQNSKTKYTQENKKKNGILQQMFFNVFQQLVSIYETDRSKRIVECMRCLRATLTEVIATVSSLDTSQINQDSLGELLDLLASVADIEKILHHVKKKGAGKLSYRT